MRPFPVRIWRIRDTLYAWLLLNSLTVVLTYVIGTLNQARAAAGLFKNIEPTNEECLRSQMFQDWTLERQGLIEQAFYLYEDVWKLWTTMTDLENPGSQMLQKSIASVHWKSSKLDRIGKLMLENFVARQRTFTIESAITIDSGFQFAVLYREMSRPQEPLALLDLMSELESRILYNSWPLLKKPSGMYDWLRSWRQTGCFAIMHSNGCECRTFGYCSEDRSLIPLLWKGLMNYFDRNKDSLLCQLVCDASRQSVKNPALLSQDTSTYVNPPLKTGNKGVGPIAMSYRCSSLNLISGTKPFSERTRQSTTVGFKRSGHQES